MKSWLAKILFVFALLGIVVVACAIYIPAGYSPKIQSASFIHFPPGPSVSVPMALCGLILTGMCCAFIVRDIKRSLEKYETEIKSHSTGLNEALYYLARGVLGVGLGCIGAACIINKGVPVSVDGLTAAQIHSGLFFANQEFLFILAGLFVLVFGLVIEYIRMENIIHYLKIKE